ncbi:Maf family protein [Fodinibius sp. Rm-B-1B1-1]|uniref:Maf family protein n=1 Tax=Fodinibius alkaliphilus TaxID=3140241 RepID=UPI00315AE563
MKTIVLASGSPRRKTLLNKIDLTFTVTPSEVDEHYNPQWSPAEIVRTLAQRKAEDIAPKYNHGLIIGADTIVAFNDSILEKPSSSSDAKTMLQKLSGKTHEVLTGVTLIKTDNDNNIISQTTFVEKTEVIFGDLDPKLVNAYVATGSPMDKAGAYGIQDPHGALFVKEIRGDYYNVVGFPLHRFYNTMKSFAPDFLAHQ